MDSRIAELLKQLELRGWKITENEQVSEWWIHKVYELTSYWNPIGKRTFLTVLVDSESNSDSNSIWAVGLSKVLPIEPFNKCMDIQSLNQLSKSGNKIVIEAADLLRNE